MKILTINSGSTSIKFKLYDMPSEDILASGKVENIGIDGSKLTYSSKGFEVKDLKQDVKDHKQGLNLIISRLLDKDNGVLKDKGEIDAIGHRVVNIGDRVDSHELIDDRILGYLKDCVELAPLHNPPNLLGIEVCLDEFGKNTANIAIFDNIFHKGMPPKAFLYGLPIEYYEKYRIRKYGFHGIAYTYMVGRACEMAGVKPADLKIIALMLGGGSSITAVSKGTSLDTSMGFTPTEGLIMSTRSGDIDPAILPYLQKKEDISPDGIDNMINKRSGVLGLSKKFSSFLDIENGLNKGDDDCKRAFDLYVYRIKKYIGAYIAAMGGVDMIVFGGGIGENSSVAREAIFKDMEILGIRLDKEKNNDRSLDERFISSDDSEVKIAIVKVDEEVIIARESFRLVSK